MVYASLVVFLIAVSTLTAVTMRSGGAVSSCCAPVDPARDVRMRAAFEDDEEASRNVHP